jgi:hypothetical protein
MFTHSLLAGFDKKGDMTWNAAFDLPDKLTWKLRPQTQILHNPGDDDVVMVYNYDGAIWSKTLKGSSLSAEEEITKIDIGIDESNIKKEISYDSRIEFWYDNYFIAYGYEYIKTKERDKETGKRKKTVFYFNKIAFR